MPQSKWYENTPEGLRLYLKVIPNAKRSEWTDEFLEGRRKLRIACPAVEGAANKALIQFLSNYLSIRGKEIVLLGGEKSREKTLLLSGVHDESRLDF